MRLEDTQNLRAAQYCEINIRVTLFTRLLDLSLIASRQTAAVLPLREFLFRIRDDREGRRV